MTTITIITMILASLFIIGGLGTLISGFIKGQTAENVEQMKTWLLSAVTIAEGMFGNKTGEIKFSYVYDLFTQKFPKLAEVLTIDEFEHFVNKTLVKMDGIFEKVQKEETKQDGNSSENVS